METGIASVNTISLIMEVEEIAPEEAPSDSDSTECATKRSSNSKDGIKDVSEGSITVGVNKAGKNGSKCTEESYKDKHKASKEETFQVTGSGHDGVGARKVSIALSSSEDVIKMQSSMPESRLGVLSSGEILNTGSLEEKLTAMFEEDKTESTTPADDGFDQSGPTVEEQLTKIFQDKSEGDEIPSSTTVVVDSPVEENLIAIFEEEDSAKSLSSQVCVFESKSHRKEHVGSQNADLDKELVHEKSLVLAEKNVNFCSKSPKSLSERKPSLKRKNTEKETGPQDFMKIMKEARVVLKKLKLPSSDDEDNLNVLPNKDLENATNHKPVGKNNSPKQNSMLKLSEEKPNDFTSKVTNFRKNDTKTSSLTTVTKTKHKAVSKIIASTVSLSQQEIKKKKLSRLSNRNSTETSHSEKLKLKPEKQPLKTLETLPDLEITKTKTSESSKSPAKIQSGPEVPKRKRGRPPLNRNKETILSSKTDKIKPVKTITKVQETALVSRVSERLQLKMMKTRAVRKKKLHGDRHEGTSTKIQKSSQKSENILKLRRTALSLAKKRKTTSFTTYGLARKRRLLNAVKTASTKRKQPTKTLMDMKQTTDKHRGSSFKEDYLDSLPEVSVALTPVLMKSSGKLVKTTLNKAKSTRSDADMNKKNTIAETNFTDSEAEERNTQKKSEHKVIKKVPLKRPIVTRSKRELGQKLIQQKKKGVGLKTIHAAKVTNMKKIDNSIKTGNTSRDTKKKIMTAGGIELRNNEGAMELLVEDVIVTENDIKDGGTNKMTMPGKPLPTCLKKSSAVDAPGGITDVQKMVEMRKAIWNLETRIDRYKLRQQAEERMVVYLSNKLHFYENNKYVQALMRMLKDAAPGPQQNQDAVFITDLLLGYCPENDNYEHASDFSYVRKDEVILHKRPNSIWPTVYKKGKGKLIAL